MNMNSPTLQVRAKAYPGLRPLQVLRDLGTQGIVASVCPAQLTDDLAADYGYRPAIGAIVDRLKGALGEQCLPRTLVPDEEGNVPCVILEARNTQDDACVCEPGKARAEILPGSEKAKGIEWAKKDPLYKNAQWNCFCEIVQTQGEARQACQYDSANPPLASGQPVHGWCYVDATSSPPTGNTEIVQNCPSNEKRIIRFVGAGEGQPGATLFITCSGDSGG